MLSVVVAVDAVCCCCCFRCFNISMYHETCKVHKREWKFVYNMYVDGGNKKEKKRNWLINAATYSYFVCFKYFLANEAFHALCLLSFISKEIGFGGGFPFHNTD